MPIRAGDKLHKTKQTDGTFNVVGDFKVNKRTVRRVANVKAPMIWYERIRNRLDNPPPRDLDGERESLVKQRLHINERIAVIDGLIVAKDGG